MGQILIIDDDESIRRILLMLLTELGFNVKVAENGKKGLALFNLMSDFDLVITDIQMPGMTGNEVAQCIRNSHKSNIPLVAMTAFPEDVQKGVFNFALVKPFDLEDLLAIVQTFEHEASGEASPKIPRVGRNDAGFRAPEPGDTKI